MKVKDILRAVENGLNPELEILIHSRDSEYAESVNSGAECFCKDGIYDLDTGRVDQPINAFVLIGT